MKKEEIENTFNLLIDTNSWYEENGFSANLTFLENKLNLIKNNFSEIDFRIKLKEKRDHKIDEFEKELSNTLTEGKKIYTEKPWVEEYYNNTFINEVERVKKWFIESKEKQNNMELYEVNLI
jgi:hypothetical protein